MIALTLIIFAASPLDEALQRAAPSQTHVELTQWQGPQDCKGNEFEPARIDSSGRVPVRVRGAKCEAWGWATIRLFVDGLVLTRDVAAGSALGGAFALQRIEYRRGAEPLREIDTSANATKALKAGTLLTADVVRVGPPAGTPTNVRVVVGGLTLEQQGTVINCRGANVCASLPSGKRVEGRMVAGTLVVGGSI